MVLIWWKIVTSQWYNQIFPAILQCESLKKPLISASVSLYYEGAELFRQRPNFLVDLAEKNCQELATLFLGS
jgi:hypothetical protein